MVFTFSVLDQKNPFLTNLFKKNQNCQYQRKFGTKINLTMRNSMMMFTFSIFDWKYLFAQIWQKSQNCQFKMKFGSKTNFNMRNSMINFLLVTEIIIRICKIQWWCLFYLFQTENRCPFEANFVQKVSIISLT